MAHKTRVHLYLSHWDPPTPGKQAQSPVIALHDWLTEPPTLHEQPVKQIKQESLWHRGVKINGRSKDIIEH